jgi:perosamine synthetase
VSSPKIPLYRAFTDEGDVQRVSAVLRRGSNWAIGPEVEQFEKEVSSYVGRKYAVSFNSGTSALHASMIALDMGRGDEVVVPSFTFIATSNAPLFVGATPVFADIEPRTYGLDPGRVSDAITKKTKAVVPVHIGGLICEGAQELSKIARERGILLVEDACEALGSTAKESRAGTFGDVSILSFCANKLISTGEGGMVLTDRQDVCERLNLIRSHGRLEKQPYFSTSLSPEYVSLGFNWRISSMTAALGISQMKKLERAIELRRKVARSLSARLSRVREVEVPLEPDGLRHTYQMYTIKVKGGRGTRDRLNEFLSGKGITSKVYFEPIHLSRFYRKRRGVRQERLPITEEVSGRVLTLPIYPTMTKEEVGYVCDCVREFFSD